MFIFKKGALAMSGKKAFTGLLLMVCLAVIAVTAYAGQNEKAMVGTLSATLDNQNKTVTAMFVGYCEGEPVIIGPSTWTTSSEEFSGASAEEIGNKLCGKDSSVRKVTKSTNTGKEIVAEMVVVSPGSSILVGR
jgi:hypothetical protein